MPSLSGSVRARLPASAFAYIDSSGRRRLPIHDVAHVRNALARFEQVAFESPAARERARARLLAAAKKHGIVPLGFFQGQLRKERVQGASEAQVRKVARWPRGTVTFLFTDIEGSTRLLERLGDGYAGLLREVRSIHRAGVRAAGGHEVDARADEFFAAFAEPRAALDAALAIQRELLKRRWPERVRVRVRIGVHTGRTTLSEAGYVGLAVHTAARVCGAASGGQVLLTKSARDALGPEARVGLRSLGPLTLGGLRERVVLYRVGPLARRR